ncbi:unnamed protein product [Rhizoctonia solani]|uniref:Uncharacterized protein n=1 Tax=Rhizoctonia solani TaxID=456999 RepID=A0A8H2X4Y9_9AGAM|nr:unnamed protein product [Rhizoctonia solani]
MAALRHPRWGLKHFESLRSYHMDTADQVIKLTPSVWAAAQQAINAVSRVAESHTKEDIVKMANQVNLKMLYRILTLMHSMEGMCRLAEYPSVITGCIKLLSTVQPTPFSYEYGYLCYNILELTLGACFFSRSQGSEMMWMTLSMGVMPDYPPVMEFSEHIDGAVEQEIQFMVEENEPEYTDWTLGWADFPGQPTKAPLVSLSDAHSLLLSLWGDRRSFFGLIATTFTPCMTVIAHLLWRFVRYECVVKKKPPSELVVPFTEILWRFMLGAGSGQQETLIYLLDQIHEIPEIWTANYYPIDPADSLLILVKYCRLLEPSNPDFPQYISISAMPALLNFVTAMVQPGFRDTARSNQYYGDILPQRYYSDLERPSSK